MTPTLDSRKYRSRADLIASRNPVVAIGHHGTEHSKEGEGEQEQAVAEDVARSEGGVCNDLVRGRSDLGQDTEAIGVRTGIAWHDGVPCHDREQ